MAVDKGAINGSHVLILPIEHFPSGMAVTPGAAAEMERYLEALGRCFASQGKVLVAFERYMSFKKTGGNHCHVNVVPIPAKTASVAKRVGFLPLGLRIFFAMDVLVSTRVRLQL